METGIPVKLEVFEGPLDLLLHLIEKNKVNIYDIPIAEITDQYMEYIHQMQREDLNIMSEFMVMAATLISIKCRMLLPKEVNEEGEEEEGGGGVNNFILAEHGASGLQTGRITCNDCTFENLKARYE